MAGQKFLQCRTNEIKVIEYDDVFDNKVEVSSMFIKTLSDTISNKNKMNNYEW